MNYLAFTAGFVVTLCLARRFPGLVDWWGRVEVWTIERIRKSCRNSRRLV